MATEEGGGIEPPDLPDGSFADDGPPSIEVPVGESDGEGEELVVIKPTGDEECQPQRVLKDPGAPSQKDIDEHEASGHATCRTWCEACVEGRGIGEPHLRGKGQESTIPILAFDYLFVTPEEEIKTREGITPPEMEECQLEILVAIDTTSGGISSHVVKKKGVEDDRYSVDKLVEDVEWLGYSQIILKSDNEPAIIQVLDETLKSLKVGTTDQAMEEHPAPYDSKANGAVENAVGQIQGLLRTLEIALERSISKSIPLDHPVISWMVEHAAFTLTQGVSKATA